MPLYSYACTACGPFSAMRSLADFQQPTACPMCGRSAERTLAAPRVLGRAQRRAQDGAASSPTYSPIAHGSSACVCCH